MTLIPRICENLKKKKKKSIKQLHETKIRLCLQSCNDYQTLILKQQYI